MSEKGLGNKLAPGQHSLYHQDPWKCPMQGTILELKASLRQKQKLPLLKNFWYVLFCRTWKLPQLPKGLGVSVSQSAHFIEAAQRGTFTGQVYSQTHHSSIPKSLTPHPKAYILYSLPRPVTRLLSLTMDLLVGIQTDPQVSLILSTKYQHPQSIISQWMCFQNDVSIIPHSSII